MDYGFEDFGLMVAKQHSKCARCGKHNKPGDQIGWDKAASKPLCASCAGSAAPPSFIAPSRPVAKKEDFWQRSAITGSTATATPQDLQQQLGVPVGAQPVASVPAVRGARPDKHQQAIIDWREGEALVAAAAGSGKTFILIERVAALIESGVLPESILTLVFNKAAAVTLRERLAKRLGPAADRCKAFTFHAFAFRVLKQWYKGDRRFSNDRIIGIPDGPSDKKLAAKAMRAADIQNAELGDLISASSQIREALIDISSPAASDAISKLRVAGGSLQVAETLLKFTRAYQTVKEQDKVLDFSDMLYLLCKEIGEASELALALQGLYEHVQQDEAQDSSVCRWRIATWLSQRGRSLVSVGDCRQAIYSFAGARLDLFRERLDKGATLLTLPVNRRSTAAIVDLGNRIAAGRDWNLGGDCTSHPDNGAGEPVQFWADTNSDVSEATRVADEIVSRLKKAAVEKKAWGILVRTNARAAMLEASLLSRKLPVRVLGATGGIWGTSMGRDFLAYLLAAENRPNEDVKRIFNKPFRYTKTESILEALRGGRDFRSNLFYSGERGPRRFAQDLEELSEMDWQDRCKQVASYLITDLQERSANVGGKSLAAPEDDREEAYRALQAVAITAQSVAGIEEQIEALKKVDENDPAVEISSIHRSKGGEWLNVFLCGVAEDVLPHKRAEDVEEERRLFYVGVTRAQKTLVVSVGGEMSSFLEDLGSSGSSAQVESPPATLPDVEPRALVPGAKIYKRGKVRIIDVPGGMTDDEAIAKADEEDL